MSKKELNNAALYFKSTKPEQRVPLADQMHLLYWRHFKRGYDSRQMLLKLASCEVLLALLAKALMAENKKAESMVFCPFRKQDSDYCQDRFECHGCITIAAHDWLENYLKNYTGEKEVQKHVQDNSKIN